MRALLKGLWEAETWSLRGWLFAVAFAMLAVTIGYVAIGAGSRNGAAGGLAGSAVLLILALGAQWLAERRGAPERERRRREEWADQLLSWPRWKQIAVLTAGVAFAVTMLILSLSRHCDRSLAGAYHGGGRKQRSRSLSPITSAAASGKERHLPVIAESTRPAAASREMIALWMTDADSPRSH